MIRQIASYLILLLFTSNTAFSQSYKNTVFEDDMYRSRISEYFFQRTGKEVLKEIRLIGNVQKPGLYHIPDNTDLLTLISIAGGTGKDADIEEIVIKNSTNKPQQIDLEDVLEKNQNVNLSHGDVVYIPSDQGIWGSGSSNNIYIIATILSVLITSTIAVDSLND